MRKIFLIGLLAGIIGAGIVGYGKAFARQSSYSAPTVENYKIIPCHGNMIIKLNTQNGNTWYLTNANGKTQWILLMAYGGNNIR